MKVEPSSIEAAAVAQNNSVADNTVIKTEPPDNAIELSSEQAKKWAQSMMMGGFSGCLNVFQYFFAKNNYCCLFSLYEERSLLEHSKLRKESSSKPA